SDKLESDTIHAIKQLIVNNSLKIAREDINNFAEVSTKDTAVTLVLQKEEAAQVVIGPLVPAPTPLPGQAKDKLTVIGNTRLQGDVSVSGNVTATGTFQANSISTTNITISDKITTRSAEFDTLKVVERFEVEKYIQSDTIHALKRLEVNNSLKIAKEDANNFAEVSTKDTAVTLVLQKEEAGQVVIGTVTVPAPIVLPGQAKDKLTVIGNTRLQGDVSVTGNFKTSGNITFGGNKTISYLPASGGNPEILSFGPGLPTPFPPVSLPCFFPTVPLNQFSGMIQSWGTNDEGYTNVMSMGFDDANAIIDIAGTSTNVAPRLLINYYCGKDVFINTGDNGGNVVLARLGNVGIGTDDIPSGYKLAIVGKTIASDEIIIKLQTEWYDFVFGKDYKLIGLNELEKYVNKNNHLPGIPSASEIKTNGVPLAEMSSLLLKKVEELTLYLIEQNKKLTEQQQKINELEEKVNNFKK
ncbi:MAG: hypothetical protein WC599_12175, partial [Bacteroidales bacterium]